MVPCSGLHTKAATAVTPSMPESWPWKDGRGTPLSFEAVLAALRDCLEAKPNMEIHVGSDSMIQKSPVRGDVFRRRGGALASYVHASALCVYERGRGGRYW